MKQASGTGHQASGKKKRLEPNASLAIDALVSRNGMYLRQAMASAELPDGRKVELCSLFDGGVFVQVGDVQVTFTGRSIIEAAICAVDQALADGGIVDLRPNAQSPVPNASATEEPS